MKIRHNAREIEFVCYCRKKTNKSANNLGIFIQRILFKQKFSLNSTILDNKIQQYYRFIFLRINLSTAAPVQGYTKTFHSQHTDETKQSLVIGSNLIIDLYVCIYSNVQKHQTLLYQQCQPFPNITGLYGFLYYTRIQASYYVIFQQSMKLLFIAS